MSQIDEGEKGCDKENPSGIVNSSAKAWREERAYCQKPQLIQSVYFRGTGSCGESLG